MREREREVKGVEEVIRVVLTYELRWSLDLASSERPFGQQHIGPLSFVERLRISKDHKQEYYTSLLLRVII